MIYIYSLLKGSFVVKGSVRSFSFMGDPRNDPCWNVDPTKIIRVRVRNGLLNPLGVRCCNGFSN